MRILLALLVFVVTSPGQAASLNFRFTGDADYSFKLDDRRPPDQFTAGFEVDYFEVVGNFGPLTKADVYLFTAAGGGGLVLNDFGGSGVFLNATGPQLFSGLTSSPTISRGRFDLLGSAGQSYQLAISAIPEVSVWALMVAGFGLIGVSQRRRVLFEVAPDL